MSAPVCPASPSAVVRHDDASSSSSSPGVDVDGVVIEPPTPHAHGHVSVAIADSHADATKVTIKAAGSDAKTAVSSPAVPSALVQMMQQRLALPLVALFPGLESQLLKLRQTQEKEEHKRPSSSPKQLKDSENTQAHNQSVMDKFAETDNGQASSQLMEQQRQLEVDAQLALEQAAIADSSQLQSTRLYANVPAMMLGEEMQRMSAFSRRDQRTVWDHVLAMGLNFQALFSAVTTMSTTAQAQCERASADLSVWLLAHSPLSLNVSAPLRPLLCVRLRYVTILMDYSGGVGHTRPRISVVCCACIRLVLTMSRWLLVALIAVCVSSPACLASLPSAWCGQLCTRSSPASFSFRRRWRRALASTSTSR